MKFARSLLIIALLFHPLFSRAAETAADAVFTNGKIYTVNEKQPWAEAMAVRGGEIVYVEDIPKTDVLLTMMDGRITWAEPSTLAGPLQHLDVGRYWQWRRGGRNLWRVNRNRE